MKKLILFLDFKKVQWFIFAIACLIYINTIPNKWTIDDGIIIHQNHFVKRGISGVDSIFTTDAFTGFFGKNINAVAGGRYRPLTPALFAAEAEIFAPAKKDYNQEVVIDDAGFKVKDLSKHTWFPNILHFFNTLWYGLLCLLIYRTLLLAFQLKWGTDDSKPFFIALISALLFTVHPLHSEAVANVKTLDEILSLLGAVASWYGVLKLWHISQNGSTIKERSKWWAFSIGSYFLALLSKESAITFVAVIPLALWFFTTANFKNVAKLSLPILIPLLLFLGIRMVVLHQPEKREIPEELMNDPFLVLDEHAKYEPIAPGSPIQKIVQQNANTFTQMPFSNKLATNIHTFGVYLKLLVVPYPLTIDYYPRHIAIKSFTDLSVILSTLVHLGLVVIALLNIRKRSLIAFGILYYFITFSIFSNLFFPIGTNMAERFMFMPSLGFCIAVAYLIYVLKEKLQSDTILTIGITAVVLLFSGLTFSRNFDWKDDYTLFSKDIAVSKNSGKINLALASEYISKAVGIDETSSIDVDPQELASRQQQIRNLPKENIELLGRAIPLLQKALEIHPMNNLGWLKLGNVYHYFGEQDSLEPQVRLNNLNIAVNSYSEAYKFRGAGMDSTITDFQAACFIDLGKLWGQHFGNLSVAIAYLEQAKTLSPNEPEVHLLLGTAYSMLGNYDKAIENTQKSLILRPDDIDTKQNLAVAYQIYAFHDPAKRHLLPAAENLLLEVWKARKKLISGVSKNDTNILQTLDLLLKNATISGNTEKQSIYKTEILKLNPNAFNPNRQ